MRSSDKSHMKEQMESSHPTKLDQVVESFTMKSLKQCSSALSRQVREAIEINMDTSHSLLNAKTEYNRCLLPLIQVLGPPSIGDQVEKDSKNSQVVLSQVELEAALGRAKQNLRKRKQESRAAKVNRSKRIKLS